MSVVGVLTGILKWATHQLFSISSLGTFLSELSIRGLLPLVYSRGCVLDKKKTPENLWGKTPGTLTFVTVDGLFFSRVKVAFLV